MTTTKLFRLAAVALCVALGAFGCATPSEPATEAAAEVAGDMNSGEILQVLQVINDAEIEQAQLALRRSDNPEVQQTAQLIIQDHRVMQQRINQLADSSNIQLEENALSQGLKAQASQMTDELAELSGEEFDREFLKSQVDLHELAVETTRDELMPNARDTQVQQLVSRASDGLQQHLTMARQSYQNYQDSAVGGGPTDQSEDNQIQDDQDDSMQDDHMQDGGIQDDQSQDPQDQQDDW